MIVLSNMVCFACDNESTYNSDNACAKKIKSLQKSWIKKLLFFELISGCKRFVLL